MLALSEGDNLFRVRRQNEESRMEDNILYSKWKPWRDVEVQTWIVAGLPWHIRIHRVSTERCLDAAEGGFALGYELDIHVAKDNYVGITASNMVGSSGIVGLLGYDGAELIYPNANTNILHPRTVIPTLKVSLKPGTHWLISAVFGEPGESRSDGYHSDQPCEILSVRIETSEIFITTVSGKVMVLSLSDGILENGTL
ncbi:hypothetical protein D3C76_1152790 [compost metagenome]